MNDRHEQSRAAFEARYINKVRKKKGVYLDDFINEEWKSWCAALDYAAEQQAAPTPLTLPDRPGWWWKWSQTLGRWNLMHVEWANAKYAGLWLPATPPPAPTQDGSND